VKSEIYELTKYDSKCIMVDNIPIDLNVTDMEIDADLNAAINILHRGVYNPSATKNKNNNSL